jgi:uncharacterized linocin/CFP29 family protein/rubrerythrin
MFINIKIKNNLVSNLLGKHPLELPSLRKFTKEELAEALRLSIIAELDAINLYLQLSRYSENENIRKVFEDIAKEEKTHVGEFLALLKELDPQQVTELKAGAKEVKELSGIENINNDSLNSTSKSTYSHIDLIYKKINEILESSRKLRRIFHTVNIGRGTEGFLLEELDNTGMTRIKSSKIIMLSDLSTQFSIKVRTLDYWTKIGTDLDLIAATTAALNFALMEDKIILKGDPEKGWQGLLTCEKSSKESLSNWEEQEKAVTDIAKAVKALLDEGIPQPYILLVSPSRYADLLKYYEKSGVMELIRIKALVNDVIQIPLLSNDEVLVISTNKHMIDLVIGADTILDYLGPSGDENIYRLWETIALRIKNPKAIIHLKTAK